MVDAGAAEQAASWPARRAILLGASNLVRNISAVVGTAQNAWGRPLDLMIAAGHGRSFGMTSCVLGRYLPSILRCGLWDELAARPPAETAALITDVGNDVLYGATVEQIAGWVERCLQRLSGVASRVVLTQLPLESVSRLGSARFILLRSVLFPRSRLQLADALAMSAELDERLVALAQEYGTAVVRPDHGWYGWDPIHIRPRHSGAAWPLILSSWRDEGQVERAAASWRQWIMLRRCRPLYRRLCGVEQRQAQPAARLRDGSLVSFY